MEDGSTTTPIFIRPIGEIFNLYPFLSAHGLRSRTNRGLTTEIDQNNCRVGYANISR